MEYSFGTGRVNQKPAYHYHHSGCTDILKPHSFSIPAGTASCTRFCYLQNHPHVEKAVQIFPGNDVHHGTWSIVSSLERLLNNPLTIIIILAVLIFLSPTLSLFLLVLLPVTGFVIGRISRTLKRQSKSAQEKNGILMSIIDETLG